MAITKIEDLQVAHVQKNHWLQKWYSFWSTTKNKDVIAEKPFQNNIITRPLWTLGRLELTLVVNISFQLLVLLLLFILLTRQKSAPGAQRTYRIRETKMEQVTADNTVHRTFPYDEWRTNFYVAASTARKHSDSGRQITIKRFIYVLIYRIIFYVCMGDRTNLTVDSRMSGIKDIKRGVKSLNT